MSFLNGLLRDSKFLAVKTMKSNPFNPLAMIHAGGIVLAASSIHAQTVEIDPAGAIPATHTLVKAWEFNTDGDAEGWTGNGYGPLTVAGGLVTGGVTNNDPMLNSAAFTALPLGYSTIVEYSLSIDPLAAAPAGGTIFWADFSGGISGARSRSVTVPEDSNQHVVRVTFPGGVKNLTQLRLDPTSNTFPKNVSFDYVRIYHYQPTSFTNVTLTASDAAGTSSVNTAGNWNSAAAPTTESNYFTGAWQLRTPTGGTYYPFGGSALAVDPGGSILFKGTGGLGVRQVTLAGGTLFQGDTGTAAPNNIARLFVSDGIPVTAASTIDTVAATRTIEISGSLSGSANLEVKGVAPAAGQDAGLVFLKSDSSSYTGTITVNNAWLDLDHDNAVAGAAVVVNSGGVVRRSGADANGTTTASSWSISGQGNTVGNTASRGAIYFNTEGLNATLAGDIITSGTEARIGMYSGAGQLALSGEISGTAPLDLWVGGGAESHIQRYVLEGSSTLAAQTNLHSEFGAQAHLRLGADDPLATNQRLRMNATWGSTSDGAGAFLDMNGYSQTLSHLQLDGTKRKIIRDETTSGNSVLTLTAASTAFDANGGNISIDDVTITHTSVGPTDSGVFIEGGSVVTLNNSTWNAPFYSSIGVGGSGSLVLNNSSFLFGGEILMGRGSASGTLTVNSDSLVSTPNSIRIGESSTGTTSVNLNGGTIAVRQLYSFGTAVGILNLDGGILRATANATNWIEGGATGVTVNLSDGGITLDSNGFNANIAADVLEDSASTGGGVIKTGAGNVTLSGNNTYTGNTGVEQGNLIVNGDNAASANTTVDAGAGLGGDGIVADAVYADGSKLPWTVSDWNASPELEAGAVTIDGALTVVVTESALANFTDANATFPILSASSLTVTNPAALTLDATGFTSGGGTWAVQQNGNSLELVYTTGSAGGYTAWAADNAGGGDANDDFDGDGVPNGVEYFMGETGSSFTSNPGVVAGKVTWSKDPDFDGSYKIQVSDTLAAGSWTDIVPPNASIDESDPNQVVFTLPTGAPRKFARLSVTVAP